MIVIAPIISAMMYVQTGMYRMPLERITRIEMKQHRNSTKYLIEVSAYDH